MTMPMKVSTLIQDRDYQYDGNVLIHKFFTTRRKGIIAIPTGGGKTIMFGKFTIEFGKKTLYISHTKELIEQAYDKTKMLLDGNEEHLGIILRDRWDIEKHIISASIQTLYGAIGTDKFEELAKGIEFVVVDEAHHIMAKTYQAVIKELEKYNPNLKILGVTATPFRTDKQDLNSFFEDMIYFIDIKELIKLGYLVPIKAKIVSLGIDVSDVNLVRKDNGEKDFNLSQLNKKLNTDQVNEKIVSTFIQEAKTRRSIFFCTSIEHAKELSNKLNDKGIKSAYIHGGLKTKERTQIIKDFHDGVYQVLTNKDILIEGFDDPTVECIVNLRPTKSLNLFTQIVGRGTRPSWGTGKKDCLLLDFTCVSEQHDVANLFMLFGLDIDEELQQKTKEFSIGSVEENGERVLKINLGSLDSSSFDFVGKESIDFITNFDNVMSISCGMNKKVVFSEKNEFGVWNLKLVYSDMNKIEILEEYNNLPDDYASSKAIGLWLDNRDEFIRNFVVQKSKSPTPGQMVYIKQFIQKELLKSNVLENLNMFDASNIISYCFYKVNTDNISIDRVSVLKEVPHSFFLVIEQLLEKGTTSYEIPKWAYVLCKKIEEHVKNDEKICVAKDEEKKKCYISDFEFDVINANNKFIRDAAKYAISNNKLLEKEKSNETVYDDC